LRTLPLAASCILAGSSAAWLAAPGSWSVFVLAMLTTFLLQILSNLANDYGDYSSGVDNDDRVGPARAMQSGLITKDEMKKALVLCAVLTLVAGIALLWLALGSKGLFAYALVFLLIGVGAIAAAFKYTVGKNPYGYRGLGDMFVFLFFGIVGVGGTFFLYTQDWNLSLLLPSATVGLLSTAVLNLNNLRDHVNDKASGKRTMVVLLGFEKGKIYHFFLVLTAAVAGGMWVLLNYSGGWSLLPILALLPQLLILIKVIRTKVPAELDSELKKVALLTFFYSLLLFISALTN
jgi:1,4-dihydroxy-2-naphthoate polyprenyltransferase